MGKEEREGLACIGAVHAEFTSETGTTNEWHYYISSRDLTAKELLRHARQEWSVESMHWLLDVHFSENFYRIEERNPQQSLNIIRKIAINSIKTYKERTNIKCPLSKIMFECLLDCQNLLPLISFGEN